MDRQNPPRRLVRSRTDRFIGGVAGGLARYFNLDPIIVRVAFIASLAIGGIGVIAYLALLIAVPLEGDPDRPAEAPTGFRRLILIAGTIALGLFALAFLDHGPGWWHFHYLGWVAVWVLVVVAIVYLVGRRFGGPGAPGGGPRRPADGSRPGESGARTGSGGPEARAEGDPGAGPAEETGTTAVVGTGSAGGSTPGTGSGASIGRTLAVIAIVLGALVVLAVMAVSSAFATAFGGGVVVAILIIGLGGVILIAALTDYGRVSLWLILPALALAIPMSAVAATGIHLSGGVGKRVENPTSVAALPEDGYRQAAGEMVVDLRDYPWHRGEAVRLPVEMGLGVAHVIVPDRVCVSGELTGKAGDLNLRGHRATGLDPARASSVTERPAAPAAGRAPRLVIDGELQIGAFEVIDATRWRQSGGAGDIGHGDSGGWGGDHDRGDGRGGWGPGDDPTDAAARRAAAAACGPGGR